MCWLQIILCSKYFAPCAIQSYIFVPGAFIASLCDDCIRFSNHNETIIVEYEVICSFEGNNLLMVSLLASIAHKGVYFLKIETQRSCFISASMFYKRDDLCWAYHLSPPHHTVDSIPYRLHCSHPPFNPPPSIPYPPTQTH